MLVKKVSYGQKRHNRAYHPELELIRRLVAAVSSQNRQSLQFKSLGIWKHFFKPYEYKEEMEVRVLLVQNSYDNIKGSTRMINKEWNLTASHKIIAPYVQIPLEDDILPIQLESITLGSKCPEKQLNIVQLKVLLEEKNLAHVKVNDSRINNYR